jgi:hypothetical protein
MVWRYFCTHSKKDPHQAYILAAKASERLENAQISKQPNNGLHFGPGLNWVIWKLPSFLVTDKTIHACSWFFPGEQRWTTVLLSRHDLVQRCPLETCTTSQKHVYVTGCQDRTLPAYASLVALFNVGSCLMCVILWYVWQQFGVLVPRQVMLWRLEKSRLIYRTLEDLVELDQNLSLRLFRVPVYYLPPGHHWALQSQLLFGARLIVSPICWEIPWYSHQQWLLFADPPRRGHITIVICPLAYSGESPYELWQIRDARSHSFHNLQYMRLVHSCIPLIALSQPQGFQYIMDVRLVNSSNTSKERKKCTKDSTPRRKTECLSGGWNWVYGSTIQRYWSDLQRETRSVCIVLCR